MSKEQIEERKGLMILGIGFVGFPLLLLTLPFVLDVVLPWLVPTFFKWIS